MTPISPAQPWRGLASAVTLKHLNFICWGLLLVGFVLPFSILVVNSHRPPNGDFAYFYSLGRILDKYPAPYLYDSTLIQQVCAEVRGNQTGCGPSPYPPFVGLVFRTLGLLPYSAAYFLWLLATLALYAAGLKLLIDRFLPLDPMRRSLLFCFAFAYRPFLLDTAFNGQISAVGFFASSLVLCEDDKRRSFAAGLALSLCTYKPTLLVLLLPMLLVTRRFKTLFGFLAGASALVLCTTAIEGFDVWPVFIGKIFSFASHPVGAQTDSGPNLFRLVDLSSFSHLVHGGRSWPALVVLCGFGCSAFFFLFWMWVRSSRQSAPWNSLLWAATLTWTLLLNVFIGIYDSIVIVPSLVVTAGVLRHISPGPIRRAFTILWMLTLAGSWFTVMLAMTTGVQLLTLLYAALGVLQFAALWRLAASEPRSAHAAP